MQKTPVQLLALTFLIAAGHLHVTPAPGDRICLALISAFAKRRQKEPESEASLSLFQTITARIPTETSVDSFSSRWEPVKKQERPLGPVNQREKREWKNLGNIKYVWGVI